MLGDDDGSTLHRSYHRILIACLALLSTPIVLMYLWLLLASVNRESLGEFPANGWTLQHWRFLWVATVKQGYPNIWVVTGNSLLFAVAVMVLEVSIALLAGYVLSRWQFRGRLLLLQSTLLLHAFPAITLIIAVFFVLRALHLLNTLAGVMLVKVALELPFALWVMKGFFDGIPWPVEMAALVDGANRFTTWYHILLRQIPSGITALSLFAFLSGWGEYVFLLTFILGEKRLDAVTLRGQHPGRRRSVCRLRIDDGGRAVLYVSGPAPFRRSPQVSHPPAIRSR